MKALMRVLPPERILSAQWFTLFCITRTATAVVAPLLLTLQGLEGREVLLSACAILYGAVTVAAAARRPSLRTQPAAWVVDIVAVLALIVAFGNWRSPFYLLALTALILPTTALTPRRALCFGAGFVLAFFATALIVGIDWHAIATTARVQSLFAHLLVPLLVTAALTFGAELLRALERERRRSERLALEAERRRIAWELHDSAKQRIHAASLLLSALPSNGGGDASPVEAARRELSAATADIETSVTDLRGPLLEGTTLGEALCECAQRMSVGGETDASMAGDASTGAGAHTEVSVSGDAPALPAFVAAHAYRIGCEALSNALRHAQATHVEISIRAGKQRLELEVADDGAGMPDDVRPGASGLRAMRNRAEALGGELRIAPGEDGRGTVVILSAPLDRAERATA